jgi:glutamate 5-kinase
VIINNGAKEVLLNDKVASLLMIGVTKIEGSFKRGDIIRILDEDGNTIGLGKSQYDSEKASFNIGEKQSKPIIKYDYLVINEDINSIVQS